jgi:hypothetical protein
VKVIVRAIVGGALVAAALVAAPASAAPAPTAPAADPSPRAETKKSFMLYAKFTSPREATYGNSKRVGNLITTQGTVTDIAGKKVGTRTTVMRVITPSTKSDAEFRDTQWQVQLKDGQIFAQAVNEDPKRGQPKTLHVMPITGGTGAYFSARGTLVLRPAGDKYILAYDVFVEKQSASARFTFGDPVEKSVAGGAPQGIGNVTLTHATGGDNSYVSIATQADSQGGVVTDSIDLQVFAPSGSLFARTIARKAGASKAQTFAILGGTGSYAGFGGELTLSPDGRSITAKLVAPGGKATGTKWLEDDGKGVTGLAITGGTFMGLKGLQYETSGKKKDGDFYVSRIVYDEVNGVTPIATMLQQRFGSGTMIVSGITLTDGTDGKTIWRPIIGGTGEYGGANGEVSSLQQANGLWLKTGRIWR